MKNAFRFLSIPFVLGCLIVAASGYQVSNAQSYQDSCFDVADTDPFNKPVIEQNGLDDPEIPGFARTLKGVVVIDNVRTTATGGQPDSDGGDWVALIDENDSVRGAGLVDSLTGFFRFSVNIDPSETGAAFNLVSCDRRLGGNVPETAEETILWPHTPFPRMSVVDPCGEWGDACSIEGGSDYADRGWVWPEYRVNASFESEDILPGTAGKGTGDWHVTVPPSLQGAPMKIYATVNIHGLTSQHPNGKIAAWSYYVQIPGFRKVKAWIGVASPIPGQNGDQIYELDIHGIPGVIGRFNIIAYTEDPRNNSSEISHLAEVRNELSYVPGTTLGSLDNPIELLVGHPPVVNHIIPDRSVARGTAFVPKNMPEFVINPTGEPIAWRVYPESEHFNISFEGNYVMSVEPKDPNWTGIEDLRFEASHASGEITPRTSRFVVFDPASNYPRWELPVTVSPDTSMQSFVWLGNSIDVQAENDVQVAAFIGDERVGFARAEEVDGKEIFDVQIFGSMDLEGETITFKTYDWSVDAVQELPMTSVFRPGFQIGLPEYPIDLKGSITSIEPDDAAIPGAVVLSENYPNPFNPSTTIEFGLPETMTVRLELFDVQGRLLETLFTGTLSNGTYTREVEMDAFPSGLYIYRLTTPHGTVSKTMHLLK